MTEIEKIIADIETIRYGLSVEESDLLYKAQMLLKNGTSPKQKKHTYFLSFNYTTMNNLNGFGNIEYECDSLIKSLDDINQITQHMIDNGIGSEYEIKGLSVLNYILLPD